MLSASEVSFSRWGAIQIYLPWIAVHLPRHTRLQTSCCCSCIRASGIFGGRSWVSLYPQLSRSQTRREMHIKTSPQPLPDIHVRPSVIDCSCGVLNTRSAYSSRAHEVIRYVTWSLADRRSLMTIPRTVRPIFDEHLTFSDQISALSKSCYSHIRELRCIRPYLDFKTANTIATSIVHSKLDYCNLLYYNPNLFSVKQASTNPELSCSCCF